MLAAAAATILIGIGQATATTTYTTIMYAANSDSSDIDVSCKDFSVASTGVLSATCNYDNDGTISTKSTTLDLDTLLGCDSSGNLSWSDTDFSDNSTGIKLELDSTGRDLWVVKASRAAVPLPAVPPGRCGRIQALLRRSRSVSVLPLPPSNSALPPAHRTPPIGSPTAAEAFPAVLDRLRCSAASPATPPLRSLVSGSVLSPAPPLHGPTGGARAPRTHHSQFDRIEVVQLPPQQMFPMHVTPWNVAQAHTARAWFCTHQSMSISIVLPSMVTMRPFTKSP